MKALIFDTETTGIADPEIIEAAWMLLPGDGTDCTLYQERFKPVKLIDLGAMATHHIIPSDLTDCRPSADFKLPEVDYLIGHNVDFDWQAAGSPNIKRICTLALSRYLFPNIDSHKQTAMLYHLFPHETAREMCHDAHNALADVNMCHALLEALIERMGEDDKLTEDYTWEDIWRISEIARIPTVMAFGKHKGLAIKDVPRDYVQWYLRQAETDPYLVKAFTSVK